MQKSFFFLLSRFVFHSLLFICLSVHKLHCFAFHFHLIFSFICNTKHTTISNSVCACSSHYFDSCDQVFFVWVFPAFQFYWIMFSFIICCMFTGLLAVELWRFFFPFFVSFTLAKIGIFNRFYNAFVWIECEFLIFCWHFMLALILCGHNHNLWFT